MLLRYLYRMDPADEAAEDILETDCVANIAEVIRSFWESIGFKISYCRFLDYGNGGIVIDFGHHSRFYQVVGYNGTIKDFAEEFENARNGSELSKKQGGTEI